MNNFETILLGIVQGLTEFLPVSSSGHLVIFENLLGFKEPEILLDASLHLGTFTGRVYLFPVGSQKNGSGTLGLGDTGIIPGLRPMRLWR
jgi:Uncharacterized bacitracin resistance protein